jgi:hypothetical protein
MLTVSSALLLSDILPNTESYPALAAVALYIVTAVLGLALGRRLLDWRSKKRGPDVSPSERGTIHR